MIFEVALLTTLCGGFFSSGLGAKDAGIPSDSGNPTDRYSVRSPLILLKGVRDYTLDYTFIVPGSLGLSRGSDQLLEGRDYRASYTAGTIHLIYEPDRPETLIVQYRHYPIAIPTQYRPSIEIIDRTPDDDRTTANSFKPGNRRRVSPRSIPASLLSISGAKGFSVGRRNGGEFSMDQSLDLAVDGVFPSGTEVELQLSDQSLPLSAAGSSMELRELDQVSFRVINGSTSATLGDYQYAIDGFEFARMDRKLEGVRGNWSGDGLSISGAGAISPGRFMQNQFNGIEGKQGPYRLTVDGVDLGSSLVVLAGTEKVYLDGELLERGENKDYTIDYNDGTIRFTSRRMVGSDSRIEVDFEYGERGKRGSLYAATFRGESDHSPLGMRGYVIREVQNADSASTGDLSSSGQAQDRYGLAYDYKTGAGLEFKGEGAYQSGSFRLGREGESGGPAGAFWLKGGISDISLFDREGGTDRWRVSWFEKRIQDDFIYPGRRNRPDFDWNWGLAPEEKGRESWRIFDLGFKMRDDLNVGFEIGRIRRGDGERAIRKRVQGSLSDGDSRTAIKGEIFSIRSLRNAEGPPDHLLEPADIAGRSITISRRWTNWTPALAYESRKEMVPGEEGRVKRFDEIQPSLRGSLSEDVRTRFELRLRREKAGGSAVGEPQDDSRTVQGRSEIEYGGETGLRIKGSTEFRRKWTHGSSDGGITTILGRGEFLAAGWDRTYSTSTTYELNSTSSLLQRAIFIPERENEGDYLEDGTYVGPGNGTHIRETVSDSEGDGRVLGASLTSVQNIDLGRLVDGLDWPLASFSHTSTLSIRNERIGDDRWRVYLFLPAGPESSLADLYESLQYRGEFEGVWGEDYGWTTDLDIEYLNRLDNRFSNYDQRFTQRDTRFKVGGTLDNGLDIESSFSVKRRVDSSPGAQTTDLRERRIKSELGYRASSQVRYYVVAGLGSSGDRPSGTKLGDGSLGPGVDLFLGGGGNLNLQYRMEKVWSDDRTAVIPIVMLAGRDVGTTHHYQIRANWCLAGSLDLTVFVTGMKRPGNDFIENTGRTDFTYRF